MTLQSQVVGAAPLDRKASFVFMETRSREVPRVKDLTATALIAKAKEWARPHELQLALS